MTAQRKERKRGVWVTTEVEVEVEVDLDDLEDEGWVYVGDVDNHYAIQTRVDAVIDLVRTWHDDTHPGPFQWCDHRPCHDLRDL